MKNIYISHRNFCSSLIRNAKKFYFSRIIEENKNDSKRLWNILSKIIEIKKSSKTKNSLDIEPNILNNHFIESVNQLTVNFDVIEDNFEITELNSEMKIDFITEEEVIAYVSEMKTNKATGADNISVKMLKIVIPVISSHIQCLINLIIKTKNFPNLWKKTIIIPVFKSGAKSDPNNYRPIAVLSIISKVFEKHLKNQITNYLEKK